LIIVDVYVNSDAEVITRLLDDDGVFPNNSVLPLMLYKDALPAMNDDPAAFEKLMEEHRWGGGWRNGIYPFHHYHSTAHEVLGVYQGNAVVQFGGEDGPLLRVKTGDVVIIPAGVAHRNHKCSQDFRVAGAYPRGQSWDMNYGNKGERPEADRNIAAVPLPDEDPVFGLDGPLKVHWKMG
jgi:uncharacterized protein YjlB